MQLGTHGSTIITNLLLEMQLKTHPQAIYTSRPFNFQNLPEPINCPNQQEFVSSRNILQIQTGEFLFYIFIINS